MTDMPDEVFDSRMIDLDDTGIPQPSQDEFDETYSVHEGDLDDPDVEIEVDDDDTD